MKLLHVYADAMTEVESVDAGHICAVVGLRHTRTGDTLVGAAPRKKKKAAKDKGQIVLAPIVAPEPVFCAAMEAESHEEPSHSAGPGRTSPCAPDARVHFAFAAERVRRETRQPDARIFGGA